MYCSLDHAIHLSCNGGQWVVHEILEICEENLISSYVVNVILLKSILRKQHFISSGGTSMLRTCSWACATESDTYFIRWALCIFLEVSLFFGGHTSNPKIVFSCRCFNFGVWMGFVCQAQLDCPQRYCICKNAMQQGD
jgi:hypothetical protein